jgi:hypothetical protein
MNIKSVVTLGKNFGGFLGKHSPTILTGIGVTGVISTIISAHNDTIKALTILDDEIFERNPDSNITPSINHITDEFTKKEILTLTWKCYIPTAVLASITIGCIVGGNSINLKRNAALAGAYSLADTALKEYKAKVVEKIGETKEKEIKDEIAQDKLKKDPISSHEVIIVKGDTLCYDQLSGRYFWSDMKTIDYAVNKVSRRMMTDMYVPLNDIYSELDIETTKMGDLMGFHIDDGSLETDFSTQLTEDGRPCLVLDFNVEPRYLKRDY